METQLCLSKRHSDLTPLLLKKGSDPFKWQQQPVRSARQRHKAEVPVKRRRLGVLGIDHNGGYGEHATGLKHFLAGVGEQDRAEPLAMKRPINNQSPE